MGIRQTIKLDDEEMEGSSRKKTKSQTFPIAILLIVIGVLSFLTFYFFNEYNELKKNPNKMVEDEISVITSKITVFMELPLDETPTMATVEDPELLKDQEFFKNSEKGDKVLLYPQSLKAILYRPSTNKVIEVAPLVIDTTADQEGELPIEDVTVEIPEITPEDTIDTTEE